MFLAGADLSAIMLVGAGIASINSETGPPLMLGGLATYTLGGPIIHVIHEEYARAGISFGLRVGLPVVAGIVTYQLTDCSHEAEDSWCEFGRGVGSIAIGTLATLPAVLIDDIVLGRVEPSDEQWSLTVRPLIAVQGGNWVGGLHGAF